MIGSSLFILALALLADWKWGEPELLWSRVPHPVVLFGRAVGWVDHRFNLEADDGALRYRKGSLALGILIIAAIIAGVALEWLLQKITLAGWLLEVLIVFVFLAQNSLVTHVSAVSAALGKGGVEAGRTAVAMIVGRDPGMLDKSGVSRAAIESLAENFSDGVVAPAFWYAVFGLPGLLAYKMINTADSMIGYRTGRHEHFGKSAAKIDDLANWLPARFSALLIAFGGVIAFGMFAGAAAIRSALRDAGLHRSPNAGWPEAAMAGACNLALGGPRVYAEGGVPQAYLNASGKRDLDASDIDRAIDCEGKAFLAGLGFVVVLAILV